MKLFYQNLEFLAPCCDIFISKFVYHAQLVVKILKLGTITILVQTFFSNGRKRSCYVKLLLNFQIIL